MKVSKLWEQIQSRHPVVVRDIWESMDLNLLSKLYHNFNAKFFDNELPTLGFKINNSKKSAAKVVYMTDGTIKHIEVSKLMQKDPEQMQGILLHEMIHVFLIHTEAYKNKGYKPHGHEFLKKRSELQKRVNFTIPLVDDVTNILVSADSKKKLFDVIFIFINDNISSIAVFKKDLLKRSETDLRALYKNMLKARPEYHLVVVQSDDVQLLKYPTKIKVTKNIPAYSIESDIGKQILKNSHKIYEIKPEDYT